MYNLTHAEMLNKRIQSIWNQVHSNSLNESLSTFERRELRLGFEDGINERFGKFAAKFMNKVDQLKSGAKDAYNYLANKGSEFYQKGKEKAGEAYDALVKFKDRVVQSIVDGYQKALEMITLGYQKFKEILSATYQKALKSIQETYASMKEKAEAFAEYIKGIFADIVQKITLLVANAKQKFVEMKEKFAVWVEENRTSIEKNYEEAKLIGSQSLNRAIELVKMGLQKGAEILKFIGVIALVIVVGPIVLLIKGLQAIPGALEKAKEMLNTYIEKEIAEYKEYRIVPKDEVTKEGFRYLQSFERFNWKY